MLSPVIISTIPLRPFSPAVPAEKTMPVRFRELVASMAASAPRTTTPSAMIATLLPPNCSKATLAPPPLLLALPGRRNDDAFPVKLTDSPVVEEAMSAFFIAAMAAFFPIRTLLLLTTLLIFTEPAAVSFVCLSSPSLAIVRT